MRGALRWLFKHYPRATERRAVVIDYKFLFEAKQSDRVLEDLRRFCFVYDTTYSPGDTARQQMNEGRREVYLHLVSMLDVHPDETANQQKEMTDERDSERPADD